MKNQLFTGVCTAMVTPFIDGKVNYPLMMRLLQRQIDSGVKTVVICGTTGEAPTLSDHEKIELFKLSKEFVGDACTVIAGTGSNDTAHSIELSQQAQEVGVDAVLVVAPYYNKGNPDGILAHYANIAHSINIPLIIYNVPSRTGVDIPVSVYKRLSCIPNIAGVKEASTDIRKTVQIRSTCPESFSVWSGNDDMIVPIMSLGGQGVISVLSNVCPLETAAMTSAALAGDFQTAGILQCKLLPLIDLLFKEVNPIPVKYAMKHLGFDCGQCRLPLGQLSKENRERFDGFFSASIKNAII